MDEPQKFSWVGPQSSDGHLGIIPLRWILLILQKDLTPEISKRLVVCVACRVLYFFTCRISLLVLTDPHCLRPAPSSYTQTQTSESAPAPITAVVKTVSTQISNDHPDWEVNERRVAKFVKKTMTDPNAGAASGTKKTTKFKFTSPIAKLKKKKAAKEESLASAIKEAAPAAKDAVTPVKMAAEETVETAKDAYKEEKESDSEPWCGGCVIC